MYESIKSKLLESAKPALISEDEGNLLYSTTLIYDPNTDKHLDIFLSVGERELNIAPPHVFLAIKEKVGNDLADLKPSVIMSYTTDEEGDATLVYNKVDLQLLVNDIASVIKERGFDNIKDEFGTKIMPEMGKATTLAALALNFIHNLTDEDDLSLWDERNLMTKAEVADDMFRSFDFGINMYENTSQGPWEVDDQGVYSMVFYTVNFNEDADKKAREIRFEVTFNDEEDYAEGVATEGGAIIGSPVRYERKSMMPASYMVSYQRFDEESSELGDPFDSGIHLDNLVFKDEDELLDFVNEYGFYFTSSYPLVNPTKRDWIESEPRSELMSSDVTTSYSMHPLDQYSAEILFNKICPQAGIKTRDSDEEQTTTHPSMN